jgi:hypothetical protein
MGICLANEPVHQAGFLLNLYFSCQEKRENEESNGCGHSTSRVAFGKEKRLCL